MQNQYYKYHTTLDNYTSRINKIESLVNQTSKDCNLAWNNIRAERKIK